MGGSTWSEDHYQQRVTRSVSSHGSAFVHQANISSGRAQSAVHDDLDPRKMKGGRRESRDSAAHPESNAVIVALDVTGTMDRVVRQIHTSLPKLMGLLERKNYLAHPQICFVAVGDTVCDRAPLQVGQFESGAEMEGDLSKFYLEGGGGGQAHESYELVPYFAARHVSADCIEKRGKKGYMFIIGDEQPRDLESGTVKQWFGVKEAPSMSVKDIFAEAAETWEIFVILPKGSAYDDRFKPEWQAIVGHENVLVLDDPNGAAQLIAAQIGMCEGTTSAAKLGDDLADVGTSTALARVVADAVSTRASGRNAVMAHTDAFGGGSTSIERL